jgi:Zn-dependent protease with chaperone function
MRTAPYRAPPGGPCLTMAPPVLKNRNRDHSLVWIGACFLAVVGTLLFCSWLICVLIQLMPAFFFERWTLVDAREVNPWFFGTVLFFVIYMLSQTAQFSGFNELRRLDTRGLMRFVGAELVPCDSGDLYFRRLLNVNEEIAIAAGRTPLPLYHLPKEFAINAFTAGVHRTEAALCVTDGALRYLSRDELQAVLAHEYGHVANGDVRTNTMLVRWLGALMPMGFHRRKSEYFKVLGIFAVLAVAFAIPGIVIRDFLGFSAFFVVMILLGLLAWLPIFIVRVAWRFGATLARLSHAAHARERELEADALSAQFTRNPVSLADALRKIAGLKRGTILTNGKATLFAHMCIAPALYAKGQDAYATHPKVEERLAQLGFPLTINERLKLNSRSHEALEGYAADVERELGIMRAATPGVSSPQSPPSTASSDRKVSVGAARARPDIHHATKLLGLIPSELRHRFRESTGARAVSRVLLGLPLTKVQAIDSHMLDFRKLLETIGPRGRLPMLELATPTLQQLPLEERASLLAELRAGIDADDHVSLHEFVFYALIRQAIGSPITPASKMPVAGAYAIVLGAAARAFAGGAEKMRAAFSAGRVISDLRLEYPADADMSIDAMESALARLRALDDPERPRVIDAVVAVVERDGALDIREFEFVRAIGAAIDCPVPLSAP